MNLWDIKAGKWNDELLSLTAGSEGTVELKKKLGDVPEDGGAHLGHISNYFVERFRFSPSCTVAPSTGDNPSTILALPLRPLDAIVSLGTSTTFLMSTPHYKPNPSVHFMNHPTTAGLYMFMYVRIMQDLSLVRVNCIRIGCAIRTVVSLESKFETHYRQHRGNLRVLGRCLIGLPHLLLRLGK